MLRRILSRTLIALALATPAQAAPTAPFFVMGEPCQLDTSTANGGKWDAFGTNVLAASTARVPTFPGALCSAKSTLVSGQTTYHAFDLASGQGTYTLTCSMYVETLPTAETRIVDFYNTTGSATGALVTLIPVTATTYRLRAGYRSESTYTCNGSTANGTECTPTADATCSGVDRDTTLCPENNHCESRCDLRTFATATHTAGQWVTWTLQQENGTNAEAAVRLWSGTSSYPTAAYARGGGFQTVGFCAGGSKANLACLTNGDCPSSTCTTTRKVTVERLRIGKTDTGTATGTIYYAKCFGYAGSTAYPNLTWDTLAPASTTTTGNWKKQGTESECTDANLHLCLNDGAAPDGDTSAIKHSVASQPTAIIPWSAVSTPSPAPTPLAVALESLWKDQESAASGRTIDLEFLSGGTVTTDYTPYELNWTDDGASALYYSVPDLVSTNATILASTVTTKIEQTDLASREGRMSSGWVSVIRQTADPTLIATLPDRNRDGEQTVRFVGDSISANGEYQNTINDAFAALNVTNLDVCAVGGTMPLDFADDWTAILNGGTSQFMSCKDLKRGTAGKVADVVAVMGGVNAWHGSIASAPSNLVGVEGGIGQDGWCETASGAGTGQGLACRCPPSTFPRRTNPSAGAERACLTKGSGTGAFMYNCIGTGSCPCASNADCVLGGKQGYCGKCLSTGLDNGAYCTSGAGCSSGVCLTTECGTGTVAIGDACKVNNDYGGSTPRPSSWCGYGCDDAPGCSGWCATTPTTLEVLSDIESIETKTLAYPTPAATPPLGGRPIVVYLTEPSPQEGSGGVGCYPGAKHHVEDLNYRLRKWTAADSTRRFIDVAAYMDRNCNVRNRRCSDESCCYTDTVHPNARGQRTMAEIIYRAFANLDGTHDGTCSGGACTTGKRGDACSSNADCDFYRMDLTL